MLVKGKDNIKRNELWLRVPQSLDDLWELLPNKMWRLHNLYYIVDEYGKKVLFKPRDMQLLYLQNRHFLNVILKARQLGFSTAIQIDILDDCLFGKNINAGIIAQSLDIAGNIFSSKIRFPYDNLLPEIKERIPTKTDSASSIHFENNSKIQVGTSLRGETIQRLHVSEFGKICAKHPERAAEIRTGALNTVHIGQRIDIESTAEGQSGDFWKLCEMAKKFLQEGLTLGHLDWMFHFYPWWKDQKYRLNPSGVIITEKFEKYFHELKYKHGIHLDAAQKAWYIKKESTQEDYMKREFPSTPEEAFEAAIEGAYFANQMSKAREDGRIGIVPHIPNLKVNTFWDLGRRDYTVIWFHQNFNGQNRFIDYYENSGELISHYAEILNKKPYIYGSHYVPHDGNHKDLRKEGSVLTDLYELLKGEIYLVARVSDKQAAIQAARNAFSTTWIDKVKCDVGIKHLDNYRKEWNEHLSVWRNKPREDEAEHAADAFMQYATGYYPFQDVTTGSQKDDERNFRDFSSYNDDRDATSGY